jgi:uncharacterized protein (TIGR02231 family)
MHRFLILSFLTSTSALASPLLADTILAKSHITAVTLYPQGAQITREVDFDASAGAHDLLITDLPADTQADLIRLAAPDLRLGAFALRTDRLPPREDANAPELLAARAAVEAAEAGVHTAQAAIDAINARIEAAEAQVGFLAKLKPEGAAITVDSLTALAQTVGAQTLAARQTALAAAADLPPAQKALDKAETALRDAQAAQEALSQGDSDYTALSVSLEAAAAGKAHLTVTHFVSQASWAPVYDLTLDRKVPALKIARGVLVSQYSGEDWAGVDLTLSTAQPSAQAQASMLWPELRRISDPEQRERALLGAPAPEAMIVEEAAVPVAMSKGGALTAQRMLQGETVVYHYPSAVNVASGVENLRLALDEMTMTPEIEARAVPSRDQTAFLLASFSNESPELLLPGTAYLYRDSALVGSTFFEGLASGAKDDIGFGAIEGLRLKRTMPERSTGDRGFISTSTEQEETAVLSVENLTTESWPVRVLDQIPYSEQEELAISYKATPPATEENYDDQRGILSWLFDLPAGETKEITLSQKLSWPEGKVLQ